ncbi:MAG TPA: glycosyltransferase [Candidatus Acidoferrales bacterium]|nr:glycosyltransferase [Candidatus Acidoferrales bacterium]
MTQFAAIRPDPAGATGQGTGRLKILSLSTEYPNPVESGKGLFVRARLQGIAALADLRVIAPVAMFDYANPEGRLLAGFAVPKSRSDDGIRIFHARWLYPPFGGWLNAFFLYLRLLWPVVRLRRSHAVELIDAHFTHPEGIAAALLARTLGIPFMITMRGSELRYRRQRLKRYWMGWALRRASRVITVSDELRGLAIELGADPAGVKTVPNGIDHRMFYRRHREECRRIHHIPEDALVVLSAGDLARIKGHHRVIEALRSLVDGGVPARLLIAGGVGRSGRYAAALRTRATELGLEDRVKFVGMAPQNTLAELMSAADVFCLASTSEGWPNVVNEALACGTPVVATEVGAVRQMLPSARFGRVVPVEDIASLAAALRDALTRTWDHAAISSWGRSRSWKQVAREVLAEAAQAVGRL